MFFSQLESLTASELKQLKLLREFFKGINHACVAFSGGVDSSLVATIAQEQLGSKAFAVTGVSPSLAPYLLKQARLQAAWIGIHHEECQTNEINEPNYFKNPNYAGFFLACPLIQEIAIGVAVPCVPEKFATALTYRLSPI